VLSGLLLIGGSVNFLYHKEVIERHIVGYFCCFFIMGIMFFIHAFLHVSDLFVLSHTIGGLIGSLAMFAHLFAFFKRDRIPVNLLLFFNIVLFTLLSVYVVFSPSIPIPQMLVHGQFSFYAISLNLIAGFAYFISATLLLIDYYKQKSTLSLKLFHVCVLFGLGHISFQFSILWSFIWWWFHVVKLAGALYIFVSIIRLKNKTKEEV
jgi:hypothetical protein